MAFPTVADADTKTGTVAVNSTSWTLTYPTNIAAGDLLLALIAADGGITTGTMPVGWTKLYGTSSGGAVVGYLWVKSADGTETGTFTFNANASEQGAWAVFRVPNETWFGGTLTSAVNVANQESVSANPDPPNLDPASWGTEDTLWIAFAAVDTSRTFSAFPTTPSVFTNTGSQVSGGAGGASIGYCRLESAVASVDPGTFTISASDDWAALTIAIRPAAAVVVPRISPYPQLLVQ